MPLLRRWQLARERGIILSAEELCQHCPELLDEVRRRIAELFAGESGPDATHTFTDGEPGLPSADPPSGPRTLGRYRLEELLGEGAFAQVWRAFDPDLCRAVAVKVPRPDRLLSPEKRQAFLEEARRVARLEHPGIVQAFDVGQEGDVCFLVSRLITGGDLARRLAQDRPPPRESARLIAELAECLHFAHQQGFVHRDIKPSNILLDGQGRPLLGDFGQAVSEEEQTREQAGIVGTLLYMAPEQAQGDSHWVDGRADIYSLGVVLYELLTGRRPFSGKDWPDLREQILSREPRPPRSLDDSLSKELERICLKCLAKSPAARYLTAADLAAELRQWLAREEGTQKPGFFEKPGFWLDALNFDAELGRLRTDFVGRAWLDDELEQWLQGTDSRVFLLVGDPGAGKSAYLAHVVTKYPQVAAYHFCVASLAESLDPIRFVQSIAAQLAERDADHRQALAEVKRGPVLESDAGALLRRLVADPLRARPSELPVVIVVDGLDEAMLRRDGSITRLLGERLDDLPPCVRLILSSRKEPEILDRFGRAHVQEIQAARPENLSDLTRYLEARLGDSALAELIARKSAGNFLYATQALQAIRSGQIDLSRLEHFPEGLVGVYQRFFERLFPRPEEYDAIRPLLEVMVAAREPLSAEQLAFFLERGRFEVESDLEKLAAFFPERQGRYCVYHQSISDWLCGRAGRSRTYRVNVQAGHRRLAGRLLEYYQAGRRDPFILAHLPTHLLAAEQWDHLQTLLTDLRFIEAKCAAGMTFSLVNDYHTALAAWPGHSPYQPFGSSSQTLDAHAALAQMRQAEAASQAGLDPYRVDTPEGRVQAFANLVVAQAHFLHRHPEETIPLARNEAGTGFVAEQAEPLAEALARPWVARDPRPPAPRTRPVCLRTLRGHTDVVLQVALRSDGRLAVSSSQDQTLRVWDVASGGCVHILKGHNSPITALAMTPDGRLIVSGADNGTLCLWETASGRCLGTTHVPGARFSGAALTLDGRLTVLSSRDGRLFLGDLAATGRLTVLPSNAGPLLGVAITPDGRRAASAARDGTVCVWDVAERQCVQKLRGHALPVAGITLAADGQTALSASYDQTLRHWEVESGKCLQTWNAHTSWAQGVALTPGGRIAVSAGWDGSLRVWEVRTGECVRTVASSPICGVALTPDGTLAATANHDQTVRIWDLLSGISLPAPATHDDVVFNFAWSADGTRAISASRDRTVRVWDGKSGECLRVLHGHTSMVHGLALTAEGKLAVSASWDGTVRVWDLDSGACRQTLTGHRSEVRDVALTADGHWALSAGYDQTVRLWDLRLGRCVGILEHDDGALCVACTPDGRRAVSGGWDGSLYLWDIAAGRWLKIIKGHRGWVTAVALTPDGRLALTASQDRTLRVWELQSGQCLRTLQGHTDEVLDVTVSPDGKLALSASDDNTVRVWEMLSGKCLAIYYAGAEVRSVSQLRPDGRFACGTVNGQIHRLTLRNYSRTDTADK